ncbi:hypothetical protein [Sorangium sp. So ce542]|uniref:hypothetical protein n=1 Tax=Sorangium sp. So ce542 TaxID=3133316 RepID=UPI003F5ED749
MRALIAAAAVAAATAAAACGGGAVSGTVTYTVRATAASLRAGDKILAEGPVLDRTTDPMARFAARHDAECGIPEVIEISRATLTTRPPVPLERLFSDVVKVSIRAADDPSPDPWRANVRDLARGQAPTGVVPFPLEPLGLGWSSKDPIVVRVWARTAPTIDAHLPIDLIIELHLSGRCGMYL